MLDEMWVIKPFRLLHDHYYHLMAQVRYVRHPPNVTVFVLPHTDYHKPHY